MNMFSVHFLTEDQFVQDFWQPYSLAPDLLLRQCILFAFLQALANLRGTGREGKEAKAC